MTMRQSLIPLAAALLVAAAPAVGADVALLRAIERVESADNPAAVGDGGRAVGVLQIWTVTVDDANRILGRKAFTYADRLDRDKSESMFWVIVGHYSRGASREVVARRWNGGPRGERKAATVAYWNKVKRELERQ